MSVIFTTPSCIVCAQTSVITLEKKELERILEGEHIQNVLSHRTADERELIITGTHSECWDSFMSNEDDE